MAAAPFLRNRYWILRQGKSIPNEKGLIVSSICKEVGAVDEEDPFKRPEGGESVEDVASRLAKAVVQMESQFQGHGDPLQILQTVMGAAMDENGSGSDELASRLQAAVTKPILSQHRKFALLTGELRAVV
ncbi:uncharacterized protein LOC111469895 [Cucurbita maxima]|uniref:Uncharacterized protein LOC111469895 n=1 Tax=Cucurbita maxima TaxID=3661 RepID=A0A6J1I7P8_CUCMA|nr:uncharacterized protein LOC111469895 [Cucurbita maxima]